MQTTNTNQQMTRDQHNLLQQTQKHWQTQQSKIKSLQKVAVYNCHYQGTHHANDHEVPPGVRLGVAKDAVDGGHLVAEPRGEDLPPHQQLVEGVPGGQTQQPTVLQVQTHITGVFRAQVGARHSSLRHTHTKWRSLWAVAPAWMSSAALAHDCVHVCVCMCTHVHACVHACFHIIPYVNCFGRCSTCV